jgi:hypothetical protein
MEIRAGPIELDYDGNQRRIRKTTPEEVTVYAGDMYERVTHTPLERLT